MGWSISPMIGNTEFSLVLFTVLIQMAVGAIVFLLITRLTRKEQFFSAEAAHLTRQVVYVSLLLAVVGIIASLVHLGHAVRAYRALFHHLSSWMGRESLLLGLFTAALAVYALLLKKGSGPNIGLEFIAAVTGVLGVLSSALVYGVLGSVPSWNNVFSVLFFLLTFILTGASLFGAIIVSRLKANPNAVKSLAESYLKSLASLLLPVIGAAIVITAGYLFYLGGRGPAAAASMSALTGSILFWVRVIIGLIVPLYLVFALKKLVGAGDTTRAASYAYGIFVLVLAGELMGRVLFYSSSVMQMMGGNGSPY